MLAILGEGLAKKCNPGFFIYQLSYPDPLWYVNDVIRALPTTGYTEFTELRDWYFSSHVSERHDRSLHITRHQRITY